MIYKPKIGLVHYTYPPVVGGVERIVQDQARLFAKYGYRRTGFAGDGINTESQLTLSIIPEFKSLSLSDPNLKDKLLRESRFPAEHFQLKDTISAKLEKVFADTDIFIIHNILTNILNIPLNAALKDYIKNHPEKKFVVWIHDVILDPMRKKRTFASNQLHDLFYKPIAGAFYVGISQFLKNTLIDEIGFPKNLVAVIPNGVDINNLLNLHLLTQKILAKYNVLDFDPLIFLPTKIMPHKNIDLCLKILLEIKKNKKNPLLIITAMNFPHNRNISYLKEIQELINKLNLSKNIIYLHNEIDSNFREIEYKIVDDFYRLSDIVFFLSSFENFGLPLLESGITKTPIMVSNLEVFKEIESENIYYSDIESESPSMLANKVIDILNKNKQISFFRKVKRQYNFDFIFQTKIIPFIDEIWQK